MRSQSRGAPAEYPDETEADRPVERIIMQSNRRLLRHVLAVTAAVIICGTLGYRLIEGWPFFDAFYMTVITLTTIGFGETHALTPAGRVFTLVLVMFGLGAAATLATQFARLFVEGDLGEYWRMRRMERTLSRLKDHVIVCGYGRIGTAICTELTDMGAEVAVVEMNEERLAEARAAGLPTMAGNATSDGSLLSAGVTRAQAIVAALSRDTDNVFVALSARDLNPEVTVIARAEDRALETRMLKAGVDRIVYPAQLGGGRIAHLVGEEIGLEARTDRRRATDVLGYELKIYRNVEDRPVTLHEVEFGTGSLRTLALIQSDGVRVDNPPATAELQPMEVALILVDNNADSTARPRNKSLSELSFDDLSVGIEPIDEEHQRLLALIHRLDAADPVSNPGVVSEVLADLRDYAVRHFHLEETLFRGTPYPDADAHTAEHRAMREKIGLMAADAENVHPGNLLRLLETWALEHVQKRDRELAPYVSRQPR